MRMWSVTTSELMRFAARRLPRGLTIGVVVVAIAAVVTAVAQGTEIRYPDALEGSFLGAGQLLVYVGAALGASAIAAEWNTGSLATLLLFDPSRVRVLVAKMLAAAIGSAAVVVVVFVAIAGVLAVGAAVSGTFERDSGVVVTVPSDEADLQIADEPQGTAELLEVDEEAPFARNAVIYTGRVMGAAALAAVFGVAVGALVRRTAAVIGGLLILAMFGELAIGELLRFDTFWGPARSLVAVAVGPIEFAGFQNLQGPYLAYAFAWTAGAVVLALVWFSRTEVATGPR